MYIGRIMHTNLVTISPEATLVDARNMVEKEKISHLLVVDDKEKLVGVLSEEDLKQNWASPATSLSTHELNFLLAKVLVKTIMIKAVVTVTPDTTIERAAYIMQQHNITSLPVMDNGQLVGIITHTDVIDILLNAIGISDDSMRLSVFVDDSIGNLADVTATLRDEKINIQSLLCWPEKDYQGITQLVIRVAAKDGNKAINALSDKGIKVASSYVKDITQYLPA